MRWISFWREAAKDVSEARVEEEAEDGGYFCCSSSASYSISFHDLVLTLSGL